jgi:hypothetical protein
LASSCSPAARSISATYVSLFQTVRTKLHYILIPGPRSTASV